MRVLIAAALIASLAACSPPATNSASAAPAPAPAAAETASAVVPNGQGASFQTPSGNIGCDYTPAGGTEVYRTADNRAELQCDRIEPTYVRITLPETAAAHVTQTDERGCCGGETIAYGDRWSEGPYTCDSTEAGLTCSSAAGHGFTLSRTQQDVH